MDALASLSLGNAPPPISWRSFPVPPEVAAIFAAADADKDGQVGRADAKAFFIRTGVPGPQLAKVRRVVCAPALDPRRPRRRPRLVAHAP